MGSMRKWFRFTSGALLLAALCGCGRLFVDDSMFAENSAVAALAAEASTAAVTTYRVYYYSGVPSYSLDSASQTLLTTNSGVSWSNESMFPYGGDQGIGWAQIGSKMFAAGGANFSNTTTYFQVYSTTNGTSWTAETGMPAQRAQGALVVHGTDLYWLGGVNSVGTTMSTIYRSTDQSASWTTCATTLPVAAKSGIAFSLGGYIWWVGGEDAGYLNSVQQSGNDPCTDAWSLDNALPATVSRYGGTVFNNKIYTVGGYNGTDVGNVYEGSLSGSDLTWTTYAGVVPSPAGLAGGYPHFPGIVVTGSKMLLIGGINLSGGSTSVYESTNGQTWTAVSGAALPAARGKGGFAVFAQ